MATEIERKFLVHGDAWRTGDGVPYCQGYLNSDPQRTVRVRIAGNKAFLTVKGLTKGASRSEFEYEIPVSDAKVMLEALCQRPLIEKKRYKYDHCGLTWEIDEFLGDNLGLIVAEVELTSESQTFDRPAWVGKEVTDDPRYFNANLVKHPFRDWRNEAKTGS